AAHLDAHAPVLLDEDLNLLQFHVRTSPAAASGDTLSYPTTAALGTGRPRLRLCGRRGFLPPREPAQKPALTPAHRGFPELYCQQRGMPPARGGTPHQPPMERSRPTPRREKMSQNGHPREPQRSAHG